MNSWFGFLTSNFRWKARNYDDNLTNAVNIFGVFNFFVVVDTFLKIWRCCLFEFIFLFIFVCLLYTADSLIALRKSLKGPQFSGSNKEHLWATDLGQVVSYTRTFQYESKSYSLARARTHTYTITTQWLLHGWDCM